MAARSIHKRTDTKGIHYKAVLDLGPDPQTGKRRQRTKDCRTKREAQAWLDEQADALRKGTFVDRSDQSVADMMTYWLDTYASTKSPKTCADYRYQVKRYILPHLGALKVQQLLPHHIVEWHALLRKCMPGRGHRTIEVAHQRLSQALQQAVTLGLVAMNPAAGVKPQAGDEREQQMNTWTDEQANTFLSIADERCIYGPVFHVSLATGMRRGELLGLRWRDVNWETKEPHVRQSVGLVSGKIAIGPPKTRKSIRNVPVADDLLAILREHRSRQNERRLALGPLWHDYDLVFTSEIGTPINPNNLFREYTRLAAAAGVSRIKIHEQRATHASWAVEEGIDAKTISERLGHADVAVTLNRYTKIDKKTHRAAAETLARKIARRRQDGIGDQPTV